MQLGWLIVGVGVVMLLFAGKTLLVPAIRSMKFEKTVCDLIDKSN